eukprot:8087517-Ditylum_brightwellii.AAC.1
MSYPVLSDILPSAPSERVDVPGTYLTYRRLTFPRATLGQSGKIRQNQAVMGNKSRCVRTFGILISFLMRRTGLIPNLSMSRCERAE